MPDVGSQKALLLENQIFRVTNGFITDPLVNGVRTRIRQVGVKTTEIFSGIEHALGERQRHKK
jgi:hypothetical protein